MSKTKQKSLEELLEEALVPEDEQPYEVPGNWVWVRLGNYLENHNGARVPVSAKDREKMKGNIPYYGASGVIDYVNDWTHNGKFVLIAEDGANLISRSKPVSFVAEGEIWVNNHAHILKGKCGTPEEYVCYYINSISLHNYVTGTAQPKLTQKNLNKIPIPVAPLDEQKRIVERIERLFAKIDEAKRLIEEVKESFELRRAAILDRAIKGKLVSQSSLDESADKLLQYIKEQKRYWGKQKKKEEPLPIPEQSELLYDIPESWCWVRLGEVIELISGRDVNAKECNNEGIGVPYIMGASNIEDDRLIIERWIKKPSVVGKKGDVLLSVKGTVGKTIIQEVEESHLSRQIMALRPIYGLYNGYLKIFIQTYVQVLKEKSKGVIPGISREDVLTAPFPLPPYNEQKRIAEKVDNLLSKLETEKEIVLEVEQKLDLLKQAILNKAFRGELGTNDPTDQHAIELLKEVLKSKAK
ncbi:restriction endonuclease subunit S [Geobacillus sp. YF-1]|uniref:restriction endonuclease subunit S n=1 Tax=Geobacillus sp. YF-1 TaxID=3457480 RepID=UPI00404610A5